MAQSCGCVFSHSKGSWVAGLQEREAHMLRRREVRRAVSTARPSPAHASGPQAPNPGSCRPLLLPVPPGLLPSREGPRATPSSSSRGQTCQAACPDGGQASDSNRTSLTPAFLVARPAEVPLRPGRAVQGTGGGRARPWAPLPRRPGRQCPLAHGRGGGDEGHDRHEGWRTVTVTPEWAF